MNQHPGGRLAQVAGAALVVLSLAAVAQQGQPGQGATGTLAPAIAGSAAPGRAAANRLVRGDRRFLQQAGADGLAGVEAARVAVGKAEHEAVRRFAERLVAEHGRMHGTLEQLAAAKGVTLPGQLTREQQRQLDALGRLQGAGFDGEFMAQRVAAHRRAVPAFRDAARNAKAAEVRAFAAAQLPALEAHRDLAQAVQAEAKAAR